MLKITTYYMRNGCLVDIKVSQIKAPHAMRLVSNFPEEYAYVDGEVRHYVHW
jgi:hypothetical protein